MDAAAATTAIIIINQMRRPQHVLVTWSLVVDRLDDF